MRSMRDWRPCSSCRSQGPESILHILRTGIPDLALPSHRRHPPLSQIILCRHAWEVVSRGQQQPSESWHWPRSGAWRARSLGGRSQYGASRLLCRDLSNCGRRLAFSFSWEACRTQRCPAPLNALRFAEPVQQANPSLSPTPSGQQADHRSLVIK